MIGVLKVKSCNHVVSRLSVFMNLWKAFYEYMYKNAVLDGEQEKGSINSVRVG